MRLLYADWLSRSSPREREAGYILHLSFTLMIVLTFSAIQLSRTVLTESRVTALHGLATQAEAVAEGGLEWAAWTLYRDRPTTTSIDFSRDWTPTEGVKSGGDLSVSVEIRQDTTAGSSTRGEITITATGSVPGYGPHESQTFSRTFRARLPDLFADLDGNPATSPVVTASSEAVGGEAWQATDGGSSTGWTATTPTDEWLEVDLGEERSIRKLILLQPDARVTDYTVETWQSGAWTAVSDPRETRDTSVPGQLTVAVVFEAVSTERLRVVFTTATSPARILEIQAFEPGRSAIFEEVRG